MSDKRTHNCPPKIIGYIPGRSGSQCSIYTPVISRGSFTIDITTFSAYDPCRARNDGHVKLNGRTVWEGGWCSRHPNLRGINTMIVDPSIVRPPTIAASTPG
jgi:hypothetical protein